MNYDPNYVIQIIRLMEELSGKHVLSNTNKVIKISTKMKSWNDSFAERFKSQVSLKKYYKQRKKNI